MKNLETAQAYQNASGKLKVKFGEAPGCVRRDTFDDAVSLLNGDRKYLQIRYSDDEVDIHSKSLPTLQIVISHFRQHLGTDVQIEFDRT